jgi:hypothetical protein
MGSRIVKQPNGLLGLFSGVVDDFTAINMTEKEAIEECREKLGRKDAIEKVRRGVADEAVPPFIVASDRNDGLDRWRAAIRTISIMHGNVVAKERIKECSTPDPAPAAKEE